MKRLLAACLVALCLAGATVLPADASNYKAPHSNYKR